MRDLFSIILPTFNRGYILGNAIKSVLSQTYPFWQLIIVDDGSTDTTSDIFQRVIDKRIIYIKQTVNKGAAAARNKAFPFVRGKWVSYLDSDNELYPYYLETMSGWLKRHPLALFALPKAKRTLELYESGRLVKIIDDSKDFPRRLTIQDIFMRKIHFDTNGFVHSSKFLEEGFRFDENLMRMEDWDFVMQIGERYPYSFLYVPRVLCNYHQRYGGDGLVSNTSYVQWAEVFEYIYQKHKHDKLLEGQTWYPHRVKTYTKFEQEYQKGMFPPPHLRYFLNQEGERKDNCRRDVRRSEYQ